MDIRIKNLSVSFPLPKGEAKVLRDADIILKSGKITAIVGESGSGKSILGAAVMGLLEQPVRVSGKFYLETRISFLYLKKNWILSADHGSGGLPRIPWQRWIP